MALAYREKGPLIGTEAINTQKHPSNDATVTENDLNKNREIGNLDLKATEEVILMHEDVSAALSSLPDFGFMTKKNLSDIQEAQNILNELRMMLGNYLYTENKYKETVQALFKLLDQSGVGECVDDLISVRRNSRKSEDEI